MRRKWAALICAIGTILAACTPERAAEGPSLHRQPLGTMVSGRVQIGIAAVDLPAGDWMLVAADHVRRAATDGSQSSPDAQVVLAKFNAAMGNRVDGVIYATASAARENIVWGRAPGCFRTDWLAIENNYASTYQHDCWYVRAWRTNWNFSDPATPVERRSVEYMARRTTLIPTTFLGTHYFVARGNGRISMVMYANSLALGESSVSTDDWSPLGRARVPSRQRAFDAWVAESRARHAGIVAGLEGRLPAPAARPSAMAEPPPRVVAAVGE